MPRKQTPTVQNAVESFINSPGRRANSLATQRLDRVVLRHLSRGLGADRQIGYVKPWDLEGYFNSLGEMEASSFNAWRRKVALFLNYAERHAWLKPRGAELLLEDVPRLTEARRERYRLAPTQMVNFLDAIPDPRDRALIVAAMNTACRGSELSALRVRDVNLETRELSLYRTKTAESDRMRITPTLERELRVWMTFYAQNIHEPLSDDMYLFPARHRPRLGPNKPGGAEMILGALRPHDRMAKPYEAVKRGLRAFGVEVSKGEGVHTLRRSAARAMFDQLCGSGYDGALRTVQAFLGHQSSRTTERYLGLSVDRQRRDQCLAADFLPFDQTSSLSVLRVVGQ